jgi:hypothetical protein
MTIGENGGGVQLRNLAEAQLGLPGGTGVTPVKFGVAPNFARCDESPSGG